MNNKKLFNFSNNIINNPAYITIFLLILKEFSACIVRTNFDHVTKKSGQPLRSWLDVVINFSVILIFNTKLCILTHITSIIYFIESCFMWLSVMNYIVVTIISG